MRVPIISGITSGPSGDFLNSYPINREPVLKDTGISDGYLRAPLGITQVATGPGADRGGINWNGICYRVMGTKLVSISSAWAVTVIGEVGTGDICGLDYSFTNLIINSGNRLYYYNSTDGLRQVTDTDLGAVVDAIFVQGYTMTTDGENLIVSDLNDPMSFSPTKYGSSEEDPDAVTGLMHIHGEVLAFNRDTIQPFQNVGGNGFPFQTVPTAVIPYGCVGPRAKCKYLGTAAFVGGPRDGGIGVYLTGAGDADKISSAEVDDDLAALTEAEIAALWLEARVQSDEQRLLLHTPYRTWSFVAQVSRKASIKTWCQYVTSLTDTGAYGGRGLAYCYGKWIVADGMGRIGYLDPTTSQHYGSDVIWQFDTTLLYNNADRAIVTGIELVGTPGRGSADDSVFFSYTKDGQYWSVERAVSSGKPGQTRKRIYWRPGVRFETYMGLRFRGAGESVASMARLECDIEPLEA